MAQQKRNGGNKTILQTVTSQFRRMQYPPHSRFDDAALRRIVSDTDFAFAEKLLHWRVAFHDSNKLLVLDQYDLQVSK